MGDDRKLEEASETTVAKTVCSQDPPKKSYGLSEQGMLLSQPNVDEDKEPTTPIPPMDSQVNSPKFAGIINTIYKRNKMNELYVVIHDTIINL